MIALTLGWFATIIALVLVVKKPWQLRCSQPSDTTNVGSPTTSNTSGICNQEHSVEHPYVYSEGAIYRKSSLNPKPNKEAKKENERTTNNSTNEDNNYDYIPPDYTPPSAETEDSSHDYRNLNQ